MRVKNLAPRLLPAALAACALFAPPGAPCQQSRIPPAGRRPAGRTPVAPIYDSIPAAWVGPLRTFVRSKDFDQLDLDRSVLSVLRTMDMGKAVARDSLLPVVKLLELRGFDPGFFRAQSGPVQKNTFEAAFQDVQAQLREEAASLIDSALSPEPERHIHPIVASRLQQLQGALWLYLPEDTRSRVEAAYKLARAKLSGEVLSEERKSRLEAAARGAAEYLNRSVEEGSVLPEDSIAPEFPSLLPPATKPGGSAEAGPAAEPPEPEEGAAAAPAKSRELRTAAEDIISLIAQTPFRFWDSTEGLAARYLGRLKRARETLSVSVHAPLQTGRGLFRGPALSRYSIPLEMIPVLDRLTAALERLRRSSSGSGDLRFRMLILQSRLSQALGRKPGDPGVLPSEEVLRRLDEALETNIYGQRRP